MSIIILLTTLSAPALSKIFDIKFYSYICFHSQTTPFVVNTFHGVTINKTKQEKNKLTSKFIFRVPEHAVSGIATEAPVIPQIGVVDCDAYLTSLFAQLKISYMC